MGRGCPALASGPLLLLHRGRYTALAQQGVDLRLAATESNKALHRVLSTATGKDVVLEILTGPGVEDTFLFKAAKGIGSEHLSPLSCSIRLNSRRRKCG